MTLSIDVLHKFHSVTINAAFTVPTPGVTVLFGPSGAGKSTIIGVIAGLVRADHVRVELDGSLLADTESGVWIPPERRRIGLVFQQPRLFPHMSVRRNLAYGQRRAPPGPVRLAQVVDLLGIGPLLDRDPRTLSGGERSRVAIGRALLAQPRLLMMDEPLAHLDEPRRAEILPYLAQLRTTLGLPILYVTHALAEAAWLGDTMVLLAEGRVVSAGPLADVMARADLPLALRSDAAALLTGLLAAHYPERGLTEIRVGPHAVWVPARADPVGTVVRLRIMAADVLVARAAPGSISAHNVMPVEIGRIVADPARGAVLVELAVSRQALLARVTPDAVRALGLQDGGAAFAIFKSTTVAVMI